MYESASPVIRPALESDAARLSQLAMAAKALWGYTASQLDAWRDELVVEAEAIRTQPTFVAELGGTVVGFYSLAPTPAAWELAHLWVSPESMRRGIGRSLLGHAVATARAGGATSITVDADPNAEPFYVGCGASRAGAVSAPIASDPDRVRPQLVIGLTDADDRALDRS